MPSPLNESFFSFRRRQETYETHLCVCISVHPSVSLSVYENYYENLTLCFFRDNLWFIIWKRLCLGKTWHLEIFQHFSQLELRWHIGERTIESWLQLNHDYESYRGILNGLGAGCFLPINLDIVSVRDIFRFMIYHQEQLNHDYNWIMIMNHTEAS